MAKETQVPDVEKATVPYKAWPMSDERGWSWTASDGNEILGPEKDDWTRFKQAHTYYDKARGATPEIKGAYSLPHHKLSNGELKTYVGGVIAATAILNGARGGFRRDMSPAGRRSLYNHLRKHYGQAGRTAPPLKEKWLDRTKDDFVHPNPKTLAERDYEDFIFALEQAGFKEEAELITKEWWMTWDPEATGMTEIPETEKAIWTEIEVEKAAVEEEDAPAETPEAGEPKAEEETSTDKDDGAADDKSAESAKEEVTKSEDGDTLKKIETSISELATATQKAISELVNTVSEIGDRVAKLESSDSTTEAPKAEETPTADASKAEEQAADEPAAEEKPVEEAKAEEKSDEKAEEKPAEKSDEKPEEKSDEPVADESAKAPEKAEAEDTEKAEETTSEEKPVQTPADVFGAFHALLESMGMTSKDFLGAMAQKSLDSMGPSLTGAVEKTVKESIGALQNGVKTEVEKAVVSKLDAKLEEVSKDFQETIEKLDTRLEKVEEVGGVPKGASGQEGTSEAEGKSQGTFVGIFSRALKKR
jgi:hypothetical protein